MEKLAIILGVHDRVDDLSCFLDILDFAPADWEKIIVYSHPEIPKKYLDKWSNRANLIKLNNSNFSNGPILSLIQGIKLANTIGNIDFVNYTNSDDWLFNHKSVIDRIETIRQGDFLFSGYNWLSNNSFREFALNQIVLHVPTFFPHLDQMESSFRNSSPELLCEFKIARWINKLIPRNKILRLSDRERKYAAIGNSNSILKDLEKQKSIVLPNNWEELWKDNTRFFNRSWQLIGDHKIKDRYNNYLLIRNEIPYRDELEIKPEFRRFLLAAQKGLPWNLPRTSEHIDGRPKHASMSNKIHGLPFFIGENP